VTVPRLRHRRPCRRIARHRSGHAERRRSGALFSAATVPGMPVRRIAVNPWKWSLDMGFNQGEIVEGSRRTLYCAGQTATSAEGHPQHAGNMGAQVSMAVDNLEAVLGEAGMSLANVVRLNIYTTDVDEFLANYSAMAERFQSADVAPPGTLLGVARLAFPELLVEIEATAVD
jgi:enamine deaminase RidA (YjgF/YER057c/UK114 family)